MLRIVDIYGSKTYEKGLEYYQSGRVALVIKCGGELTGEVVGNERYRVKVDLDSYHGTCSCPVRHNCKHAVALLLSYLNGDYFDADNAIRSAKKADLAELVKDTVSENPFLAFKLDKRGELVEKRIKSLLEEYIDEEKADEIARMIWSCKSVISKDFVFWMLEYLLEYCERSDCLYNDYYDYYYGGVIFEALCDVLAEKDLGDEDFERIEDIADRDDFGALYPFFRRMIKHAWKFRRFDPRKYLSTKDYIEFLINADRRGMAEILLKKANLDEKTFFRLYLKINEDKALKFAKERKLYSELIKCCEDSIIEVFDRVVEEDAWIDESACRIVFERAKAIKNPSTLKRLAEYCVKREYHSLAADIAISLRDYKLLKKLARADINTRLKVFEFVESGEFVEDIKATIEELIDERKRDSYRKAVKCLKKLERLMSEGEWKEYVSNLYREHKRKSAFWEEFESAFGNIESID